MRERADGRHDRREEAYGVDTFVVWGEGEGQLDRVAREVVPAARERLDATA